MKTLATVDLSACSANSFEILGTCQKAAREAGASEADIRNFMTKAMEGNQEHLLSVVVQNFELEWPD
ncbi:hypothetical protein C1J03_19020 [Sulfitobacter sp. SK012]|uniref:hypothetical protein n=1 Tax=Sulfitobacter sp. SK012 TaxID=1389005 RepID=UPI000E0C1D85|nr:hypothetical protein [Sulfitobacter sp. SK012]AXI46935.1 hypothetical protein C1J03_13445 [Sulfitobacter sp. SK012]AXI47911.1 hypothetical protein C1J03_19020 [Sulfitobacter sp. SK012]